MSRLTGSEARGLMEAYNAVYTPQEESLEQEIFEAIAYALISQGHTAIDVLEYFAQVDEDVIIEDIISIAEGTLLIEEVVAEEYLQEQYEILSEALPAIAAGLGLGLRALVGAGARRTMGVALKRAVGPGVRKAVGGLVKNIGGAVGKVKNLATGALNKLPGGSQGKLAGLVKGGTKLALGGAAFEAGMRGAGALMGDKGPSAKTAPGAPPSLKAKQDYAKSKGKYYSSSDQKTYANYNDALAARNSRLGKLAPTPPKTPSTPSSTPSSSTPSTPKPAKPATFTFNNKQVTDAEVNKTYDELKKTDPQKAADFGRNVHSQKYGQPTQGPSSAKIDPKSVEADLKAANDPTKQKPAPVGSALRAQQDAQAKKAEEEKKKAAGGASAAGTTKESYDAYDIVLEYLISGGHVESISEAHYVMLEMDSRTIRSIVEDAASRNRELNRPINSPIVSSSGGAGGEVTADKGYPATLGGLKGVKSTDKQGGEYFMPYMSSGRTEASGKPFKPNTIPDQTRAQYKNTYTNTYKPIPRSQSTQNPDSHISRTGVPRVRSATRTYGID